MKHKLCGKIVTMFDSLTAKTIIKHESKKIKDAKKYVLKRRIKLKMMKTVQKKLNFKIIKKMKLM